MKFLFITATPLSPIHGSGTYVGISTLERALRKLGHSVEIVWPNFWCPNFVLRRYLFNRFLPLHHGTHPVGGSLSPSGGEETSSHVSHEFSRGNLEDTVIVGFDCDGFYWASSRRERKVPYIVSLKGILADEARHERGIIRKILELQAQWEKMNVQQADLVLVTSRYCQKITEEMYGVPASKIRIVPELIDLEEWERLLDMNSSKMENGKWKMESGEGAKACSSHSRGTHPQPEADQPLAEVDGSSIFHFPISVLTVCRMYPRKNLGLLLRTWVHVRKKHPHAQLRIVGTGQEYLRWKRLARSLRLSPSVQFLGNLTRDQLAQEYKNCDIFCLPSRQEGFGIVFLEAMAAGKPIVAMRAAAIPEVVHHEEHGLLVHPDSEGELAQVLVRLMDSPQLCQRMGLAGQQWVKEFDAAKVAQHFLSILSVLLTHIKR